MEGMAKTRRSKVMRFNFDNVEMEVILDALKDKRKALAEIGAYDSWTPLGRMIEYFDESIDLANKK